MCNAEPLDSRYPLVTAVSIYLKVTLIARKRANIEENADLFLTACIPGKHFCAKRLLDAEPKLDHHVNTFVLITCSLLRQLTTLWHKA
jgi:hypothetical protein